VKNKAMTKAAIAMPKEIAKPIWVSVELPASVRDAKVAVRMRPAAATVGPACRTAIAAASRGLRPARASSLSRAIMRML
jgi:hypothetical protein